MIYACVTTCGQIYPESMRKFSAYTLSLIMSYNACLKGLIHSFYFILIQQYLTEHNTRRSLLAIEQDWECLLGMI